MKYLKKNVQKQSTLSLQKAPLSRRADVTQCCQLIKHIFRCMRTIIPPEKEINYFRKSKRNFLLKKKKNLFSNVSFLFPKN